MYQHEDEEDKRVELVMVNNDQRKRKRNPCQCCSAANTRCLLTFLIVALIVIIAIVIIACILAATIFQSNVCYMLFCYVVVFDIS